MAKSINSIKQTNGFIAQSPQIATQWSNPKMSQTNAGTGMIGKIIPIFFRSMTPGEKVKISQEASLQFIPFMSNLFHQIDGEIITYFVPDRLCTFVEINHAYDNNTSLANKYKTISGDNSNKLLQAQSLWENFITGGVTGQPDHNAEHLPTINLKTLKQQGTDPLQQDNELVQTLADYFGMKLKNYDENYDNPPNCRLWHAYNFIYNEMLRNPDFTIERDLEDNTVATAYWESDRFTHARKQQLRGTVPSVPLSDEYGRIFELTHNATTSITQKTTNTGPNTYQENVSVFSSLDSTSVHPTEKNEINYVTAFGTEHRQYNVNNKITANTEIENHTLQNVGINLNDLLINLAIMKYETNNERMRPYYKDQLYYRFGIENQDVRLDKPELIGRQNINIGIQTVTQTSAGGNASSSGEQSYQGNITSQGWGNGQNGMTYSVKEHGILMSLMIIRPKGVYEGGMERMWRGDIDRFDFITPELVDIPDVAIEKQELYYTGNKEKDKQIWGYQAIYDEFRTMENRVCGWLRPSVTGGMTTFTLARLLNENTELNDSFLKCNPDMQRIKQYTGFNVPDFLFFTRTTIKLAQPLPLINNPTTIM